MPAARRAIAYRSAVGPRIRVLEVVMARQPGEARPEQRAV